MRDSYRHVPSGLAALMVLLSIAPLGCSASDSDVTSSPNAPKACIVGELRLPDGRCQPAGLPLDMACAPGELASEDGVCQAAGVPPSACGAGFLADDGGGCEPVLPEQACPVGQMAVPGETACREVAPCGEGTFGEIPIEGETEFVDASYLAADSDGSQQKPWKTVQQGVDAASPGAIVAVAAGRYDENVVLSGKPVRLWGRCPAKVAVAGPGLTGEVVQIVNQPASGSEVHGITLTGAQTGLLVLKATSVTIDQVWIQKTAGPGVRVVAGGSFALSRSLVEQTRGFGLGISGSDATIEASVVRGTLPDGMLAAGQGVASQVNPATGVRGKLTLRASIIEQNHTFGVGIIGTEATIEDSIVRGTLPNAAGLHGRGIILQHDPQADSRASLTLRTSLVDQNREVGVLVISADATIENSVVRATRFNPTADLGRGIDVQQDTPASERGVLTLRSSLIDQNEDIGVLVDSSDATIEGSIVRATQAIVEAQSGMGILVQQHNDDPAEMSGRGALTLKGSVIEWNTTGGVLFYDSDGTIEDSIVRDTQPIAGGLYGFGVLVQDNEATSEDTGVTLRASLIEHNHSSGVLFIGANGTIEASIVRETQTGPQGTHGMGVVSMQNYITGEPARMTLRTSLVADNATVGVLVYNSGATIEDSIVQGTLPRALDENFGDGVIADGGGCQITATRIVTSARAGVLFVDTTGVLSGVSVSENRFGLVVQGTSQPTLGEGNVFENNTEQNRIIGGDLAVPDSPLVLP